MSDAEWIRDRMSPGAAQFWCNEHPDWFIYDQSSGFMVWQEFRFHGRYASFDEAKEAVRQADR